MSYAHYGPTPQAPPPWPPQAPERGRAPSRLLPILGAILGSLGLIIGVAAWFRAAPAREAANPVYSEQQVADAKTAVCEAHEKGSRSLQAAGSKKPDNPADTLPVTAVNARLAEVVGSNLFFDSVESNPAAPKELSNLVHQLGELYRNIALIQLADGSKTDISPIAEEALNVTRQIDKICQ